MGKTICQMVLENPEFDLAGASERKDSEVIGQDLGEIIGGKRLGITVVDDLNHIASQGDVLIDFTSPGATLESLGIAVNHAKPMVIGTTGLSPEQIHTINSAAQKIPCLLSPNMSIGVNLMFALLEKAATTLGDSYDIEIIEAHHRLKVDAPSGTAMKMAEILCQTLGRQLDEAGVYGRKGMVGQRGKQEIAIHAVRGGDIVGEHHVVFAGPGERIELTHRAHSRQNFARGALQSAKWIINQAPGRLYSMKDVLGF
jgi:4-hydroxy-tetrahydrodipicolinate reductase